MATKSDISNSFNIIFDDLKDVSKVLDSISKLHTDNGVDPTLLQLHIRLDEKIRTLAKSVSREGRHLKEKVS